MPAVNNWYVLTGGPSSGKTTLLKELQKLGYPVVHEAARTVIDEAAARGITPQELRKDEKRFQDEVIRRKVEVEAELPKKVLTFFDRGMHDTLAYLQYYGFVIDDWIAKACRDARYKKVFLLDPLATYEENYARTEAAGFHVGVHHLLRDAYEAAGMQIITIPPVSVTDRINMILQEITITKGETTT